jgi:hypothetical protein
MENIHFDIFKLNELTNSYPYTIEDCGVTFIMYINNIMFVNNPYFFNNKKNHNKQPNENFLCYHTNYRK